MNSTVAAAKLEPRGSSSSATPAVLLDMDFQGLGIARSLGRRGIPVYAVDSHPGRWSLRSRYCRPVLSPGLEDEEPGVLQVLLDLGRRLGPGAVLFPLHDGYLEMVARHRAELDRWFRVSAPAADLLWAMTDKRRLTEVCCDAGTPMPETHIPTSPGELEVVSRRIRYPCLIKPASNRQWHRAGAPQFARGKKVLTAGSAGELVDLYQSLPEDGRELILQEVIPGSEEQLHYFVSYLDARSRPLGAFVFRKLRTLPMGFGVGTFVESVEAPAVIELSRSLLSGLSYRGNVGVEWKLDPRDGQFKLIEINARYGLWDWFGAHCGVDFAYLAWADLTANPVPEVSGYRTGQRGLNLSQDLWAARERVRARRLTWMRWLASLPSARAHPVFAWDDPQPFVHFYRSFLGGLGRRARTRLLRWHRTGKAVRRGNHERLSTR